MTCTIGPASFLPNQGLVCHGPLPKLLVPSVNGSATMNYPLMVTTPPGTQMQSLPEPSKAFRSVATFVRDTRYDDLPDSVVQFAALLVLDLIGVAAAASRLAVSRIARNYAARHWLSGAPAEAARMLFDGRSVSMPGAAFAAATQIDNLDAHDGWQASKGHAGAGIFPALAALSESRPDVSGRDALAALVVGYEVSYRAARALHATVPDYHTSGAWNALGCVAIGARLRGHSEDVFRHALGIAEYHAPRSQMMREIANPTMLHDGSGWGAPTGIYATLIAEEGFEGAPAALVEFDDARFAWEDLGEVWLTAEQYIKPYPICRWAHAPIDAALALRRTHDIRPEDVEAIEIETFRESAALSCAVPTTTSNAQYSLAWPVAAALARGRVTVSEVLNDSFTDPTLRRLTERTTARATDDYNATFPAQRMGAVTVQLSDGRRIESGPTEASGGPKPLPTEDDVIAKFQDFAEPVLGRDRAGRIIDTILGLNDAQASFRSVMDLVTDPVEAS